MSTYKTIAESNSFIVLDKFTKYFEVNEPPAVYQTEAALEKEFIQDLINQGYENPKEFNTMEVMLANVKVQLQLTAIRQMKNSTLNFRPNQLLPNSNKPGIRRPYIDIGEYLTLANNGYFEIARILLSSSTCDVISIRAKAIKKGYKIKVEAEYETIFSGYKKVVVYTTYKTNRKCICRTI